MNRLMYLSYTFLFITFFSCIFLGSCKTERGQIKYYSSEDSLNIINEILDYRKQVDSSFRFDPQSPFNRDSNVHFTEIKWFPPNLKYYFKSKLFKYEKQETVKTYGTKGDEREYIKYGYFKFIIDGTEYKLNVYKFVTTDPQKSDFYRKYLSVWFTDKTTGSQTYQVGRYVDVGEENNDPNYLYIIDFNKAYNPYCAYSSLYSCVIPRKEDFVPLFIEAGEKKYHH